MKLFEKFTQEGESTLANKLFFIDKDYEHHQVNSDIYTTPKYAVENFYVSSTAIKKILKGHFGINDDDPEFGRVLEYFNERYREFIDYLTDMNLWAICCQLNGVIIDFDLLGLKRNAANFFKIGYKNIELSVEDISFNFFESMYEEMLSEKIKNGCKKNGRDYVKELSIFRDKRQYIRYNFENDMEEYRVHIKDYFREKQLL